MGKMRHNLHIKLFSAVIATMVSVVLFWPATSRAQEAAGSEFSLHVGQLLPNQIEGITEILPVFGARYAMSLGGGYLEFGFANTHALGVDYTTVHASLRGEFEVAQDVLGTIYAGPDFAWYLPEGADSRRGETGIHIGGGALMKVTNTLWLRTDLKFTGGPGTSLYFGFGVAFRDSNGG